LRCPINALGSQGSGDLGVTMRLICKLALLLPVVFASSPATSGEWKIIPTPKAPGYLFAEFKHDDDGRLFVMCDKEAKLITIGLVEPRATWKTGESIKITVRSDVPMEHVSGDGRQPEPSTGVVIGPTQLGIYPDNDSNWDFIIMVMALAKDHFTVSAAGYRALSPRQICARRYNRYSMNAHSPWTCLSLALAHRTRDVSRTASPPELTSMQSAA
jgi:hypothetical protein